MGIYYLDARMVSKAKQSAVAKASYTSNEKLYSERDDEYKQYRNRSVKPESFILAPKHAPEWVYNRERLWNEVEKIEKNYNSQLLREIVVALPIELTADQQSELLKEYVKENFVNDGMVADVHIHRDQEHNPHAHILLTVRPFKEDGTWWETKSKKEYILDEKGQFIIRPDGSKKNRKIDLTGWNSKEKLLDWRKNFAEKINQFYKKHEIEETVSHLSYEEQGKEKIGKHRLSRNEFYIEKQEEKKSKEEGKEYKPVTHYGEVNSVIDSYNKEIEIIDSKIISLENYKEDKNKVINQKLDSIRNKVRITDFDYQSIQFVKNRTKSSYIDYKIARKNMDSLDFWKLSIDRKQRAMNREKRILETARNHYEKNSNELYKLGFTKNDFVSEFNQRASHLQNELNNVKSETEKYNDALKFSSHSLHFQEDLLQKEFVYLYPKYKEVANKGSLEIFEIMNKSVQEFKETGELKKNVIEFDKNELFNSQEEQKLRSKIWSAVLNYRNHSKQYFSLNKQLEQKEELYKNTLINNKDLINSNKDSKDQIYNSSVAYLTVKNEFDNLSSEYNQTKNTMYNSLIELYGVEQESVIDKLPDRIKVLLLEKYLQDRTVEELKDDLNAVNWTIRDKKLDVEWNKNNESFTPFENSTPTGNIGNILTGLIEQAKNNENKYDDIEARRKRAKRKGKKLTKEELLEHD